MLAYFYGLKSEILPSNLIQAQRDYFGGQSFERIDKKEEYIAITKNGHQRINQGYKGTLKGNGQ